MHLVQKISMLSLLALQMCSTNAPRSIPVDVQVGVLDPDAGGVQWSDRNGNHTFKTYMQSDNSVCFKPDDIDKILR
jgi:hypothetical protein